MPTYGTTDRCTGGTASASTIFSASYVAAYAFDNNAGTDWLSQNGVAMPQWLKYDFGAGVSWAISRVKIKASAAQYPYAPKTRTIQGSNNDSTWVTLDTQTNEAAWTTGLERTYDFINQVKYRYIMINITESQTSAYTGFAEVEMFEGIYPIGGGILNWFFSEAWRKHNKLWTPKLILPKEGFSY